MTWELACYVGLGIMLVSAGIMLVSAAALIADSIRGEKWATYAMGALFAGFLMVMVTVVPMNREHRRERRVDAQECVDSGGVPYRPGRRSGIECVYPTTGGGR